MGTSGMYANAKLASNRVTPVRQKKEKKMGFFQRWLLKQVQQGHELERDSDVPVAMQISAEPRSIDQPERSVQFTVYTANGGRVIETRKYDRQKDRHNNNLYVITSDQDFGREIDKIITMEALR